MTSSVIAGLFRDRLAQTIGVRLDATRSQLDGADADSRALTKDAA